MKLAQHPADIFRNYQVLPPSLRCCRSKMLGHVHRRLNRPAEICTKRVNDNEALL